MLSYLLYSNKHWKPPYAVIQIIVLLFLLLHQGYAQIKERDEPVEFNVEIIWETSPTSIKFTLNDTDNYAIENVTCKSVKTTTLAENFYAICDNLDSCTNYAATVTIKDLNNESQPPMVKTVDVTTNYDEPMTEIVSIEAGIDEILLTWKMTNNHCISKFQIELKSSEKEYQWTVANEATTQIMDGLSPCLEYNVQLKTYDNRNTFISNATGSTTTLYTDPGNVTVVLQPHNGVNMKVSWEPPSAKFCIEFYYLKWYIPDCDGYPASTTMPTTSMITTTTEGSFEDYQYSELEDDSSQFTECEWSATLRNSNSKEYIITYLQGCQDYIFEMHIDSYNNPVDEPKEFVAPEQVPGPVTLHTFDIGSMNATILWNPPIDNSKCVAFYEVVLIGPLQDQELQQTIATSRVETNMTWNNLCPCGQYNVSIIAKSGNTSDGASVSSTFETNEAKPTAVQDYNIVQEPNALVISWSPPALGHLCLNGYRISGWREETESDPNFDLTTNDTSVRIEDLYSCQSYTIQIIPTTKLSQDGDLKQIDTQTSAKVAQTPTSFQIVGLYPHSFELSAQDSDFNNKCETIFARFVCAATNPDGVMFPYAVQYVEGRVGGISFKADMSPLSAYTEYKCDVSLFNVAGWSPEKELVERTAPYFPDPPEQITLKDSSNSSLNFSWRMPTYPYGDITLYILHFQRVEAAYFIPEQCSVVETEPISGQTSATEHLYTNLLPYSIYSLQVAAKNLYGVGEYTRPFMVITDPYIPDPVMNLHVNPQGPFESDAEYKASVTVSWVAPCKSNGLIESYELDFLGTRSDHDNEQFQRSVPPNLTGDGFVTYEETNLKPEFNYTVSVRVMVKSNSGSSLSSSYSMKRFDAPAGIPQRFDEETISRTEADAFMAQNPSNSAFVRIPASILESESGTIIYVALLISEKGCNPSQNLQYGAIDSMQNWPAIQNWNDAYQDSSCIYQYQTTPMRWKPVPWIPPSNGRESDDAGEFNFTVGVEKCNDNKDFCNGPLKPDTEYNLVIRLFTKSGYNDAALLHFKTDSLIQVTIIIVGVTCCLLLAFIGGLIYLWISKKRKWERESCHGIDDAFGNVYSKNFAVYYRELSKPEKVSREFKELTMVAMDLSYAASEMGYNKNRYADIFPYDKNRVILDIDADGSDYINASFIDGYRKKKEYIATQGPKPESTMDFWRMVLQHNVRVIVMVTQFREGDLIKCHEYFPYSSKAVNALVKRREQYEIYDRTELMVTHDQYGIKQKVVHFYFKKWPDHGVPADPMSLITFVRKVKAEKVPSYSPIIVHCSAGVGRTGTFIGLDIIMQRLRNESKINIYETVKKLRFQRMKMVQTLAQYTFLYTCAYELVKHKNTRNRKCKKDDKRVTSEEEADKTNNENDTQDNESVNGNSFKFRAHDLANFISSPIKFSGMNRNNDLESLDEHPDGEENCSDGSNETAT